MVEDLFEEEGKKDKESSDSEDLEVFTDEDPDDSSENNTEEKSAISDDEEEISTLEKDRIDFNEDEEEEIDIDDIIEEESEAQESVSEDDDAWIPLEEEIATSEEEESGINEKEEVNIMLEEEEEESEAQESVSKDEDTWIPLEDEEGITTSEDEAINEEDIEDHEKDIDFKDKIENDEDVDIDAIIAQEGLDIEDGKEADEGNAEAPPWDEEVEIPLHGATKTSQNKNIILIVFLSFLAALIGVGFYGFFKFKRISENQKHMLGKEESAHLVTNQMTGIGINDAVSAQKSEETIIAETPSVKVNAVPTIRGTRSIQVREGEPYSFIPKANDEDATDTLIFFIANQPAWTTFDTATGSLTGTPHSNDAGSYDMISILVSDGRATASLPEFSITVTGIHPEKTLKKQEEGNQIKSMEEKKSAKPEVQKEPVLKQAIPSQVKVELQFLPILTNLIKQSEFQDAAIEYHKHVKNFPKAYSLKLEVDCVEASVKAAYEHGNFDSRMFILPKAIEERNCFVVLWGLYATKGEALTALSSVPAFFKNQATKPKLIMLMQYL